MGVICAPRAQHGNVPKNNFICKVLFTCREAAHIRKNVNPTTAVITAKQE